MGNGKMAELGRQRRQRGTIVLEASHQPETLRFFLLSTHYRSPSTTARIGWQEVQRGPGRLLSLFRALSSGSPAKSFYELAGAGKASARSSRAAMPARVPGGDRRAARDVPGAHGRRFQHRRRRRRPVRTADGPQPLCGHVASLKEPEARREAVAAVSSGASWCCKELSQILGLFCEAAAADRRAAATMQLVSGLMQLAHRPACRGEHARPKNFALADQIRKRLGELGVTLEDRPGGTGWRVG